MIVNTSRNLVRMAAAYVAPADESARLVSAYVLLVKEQLRDLILTEGKRPDGRGTTDIRQIDCEVGLLPRVHGTGLFTRGQTQVLTTLALGSGSDAQIIDTLEEDGEKHYMHFDYRRHGI